MGALSDRRCNLAGFCPREVFLLNKLCQYDSKLRSWFADIPQSELEQLLFRSFEANEFLTIKGRSFAGIYIVLDGICNVINQLDNGSEVITLKLTPGCVIGVSESVANSIRYIASVKACTPVDVVELDDPMFNRWLAAYPSFVHFVLRNMVARLHYTADLSANCRTGSSQVNMAKYLIDRYSVESGFSALRISSTVKIQETHEFIGNYLGISPRTVERIIRALRKEGLISMSKGKICISAEQYQALLDFIASNL